MKRILAYILFGLGFLTLTFFRNYFGTSIPYPSLIWIIGLAMFIGGWQVLRWTPTLKSQKDNETIKRIIDDLKTNGEKIKIDFSKCEIKENNYLEQKVIDPTGKYLSLKEEGDSDYSIVQALAPKYFRNRTDIVQVNQSVLIYTQERQGNKEKFISSILPFEKVTLIFKLDTKKITILYVDKNDRNKYYFDMEFLFL
jgi:hypothetical protein